jgi:hypothetical protein
MGESSVTKLSLVAQYARAGATGWYAQNLRLRPSGLELSRLASPGLLPRRAQHAAGQVGSSEFLGDGDVVLRDWVLGSGQYTAQTKAKHGPVGLEGDGPGRPSLLRAVPWRQISALIHRARSTGSAARPCRILVFSKEDRINGFVGATEGSQGRAQWRAQFSDHRFLHKLAGRCLFGGSQILQREGGRPPGAFVEVRRVA